MLSEAEATRKLLQAIDLYRKYPDDSIGVLQGAYQDAIRAGLTRERIESLVGMSIAKLEEKVSPPGP